MDNDSVIQQAVSELIRSNSDIVDFGTRANGVSDDWIAKAESRLHMKLTKSYIWFLKNYAGGFLAGNEIYSIYEKDFDTIVGGDIVHQHILELSNGIGDDEKLVVYETDFGEVFFFNYNLFKEEECPIYLRLPSGESMLYANDFYQFLIKLITLYA